MRRSQDARVAWPPEFGPGIYVHVPLCRARCPYCDFYSETAVDDLRASLLDGLEREALAASRDRMWSDAVFRTVYIGGGTPSLLGGAGMRRLLGALRRALRVDAQAEVTVEANPESIRLEVMEVWRAAGVNRVSLGAQSMDDAELRLLGRRHDAAQVVRRVSEARAAGLREVSLDLIYGLPGSTLERWERTLDAALSLSPDHLSAYLLTLEEGVPMARRVETGELTLPDDDEARDQYDLLCRRTGEAGLLQYEISNFARPGAESRHNQNYWVRGDYLGLGPAAHSHWRGRRWANPASFDRWAAAVDQGSTPGDSPREEPGSTALEEWLFLGLRRTEGVPWSALREAATSEEQWRRLTERAGALVQQRLLEEDGRWLRLSPQARFVSNGVFSDLMAAVA
jgi:oxygen-independent coproporphyrinogen-3 oxidase